MKNSSPETVSFESDAIRLEIPVHRDRRYHSIRLGFDRNGRFSITVPPGIPLDSIHRFLRDHSRWILHRINRFESQISVIPATGWIPYFGRNLRVCFSSDKNRPSIRIQDDNILITGTLNSIEQLADCLKSWLKQEAAKELSRLVDVFSREMGVSCRRLCIRDQKSRWGSCSSRKTISLNWKLILLNSELRHYVVYHELAHLIHLNHSSDFWAFLSSYCWNARENRRTLRGRAYLLNGFSIENQLAGLELIPEMP